jgi:hypothetical protein
MQTQIDAAREAIALERFRLKHGAFPEKLEELVPEYLPMVPLDIYTKKPLIYKRTEGGTFVLYGVGKNHVDDGGKVAPKARVDRQLDEVWLFAPVTQLPPSQSK